MIPDSFKDNRKTVCVQGLGFVGSAMALAIADADDSNGNPLYNVIGVDVPNEAGYRKADSLNDGVFPFENNDKKLEQAMKKVHDNGNLWATTEKENFKYADVVVVDINLDVYYDDKKEPYLDLTMFKNAMHDLGENIKEGTLVIVETTVPPGTCEKVVYPILKEELKKRGLDENDLYVAHSYERVMPGENYFDSIVNFWRVYSGINDESADRCEEFLKTVIKTDQYPLTRLEKTTATEISKVLENSYRATTIAFMEEWGRFAEAVGVDLFDVINAIRMRPTHSNMRQPGFGVGGYCLTKDPYFAKLAAKDIFGLSGMDFPFSTLAVKTNNVMPLVSLDKIEEIIGDLSGKKMLVLGVSYRQDVGDTRYSPTEIFVKDAVKRGCVVECQDPLVGYWQEMECEVLNDIPSFEDYDIIMFAVQHKQYEQIDFSDLKFKENALIFDGNCVLSKEQIREVKARKDIRFGSIGR
ncbi:MAG: nucleotide sugar dehydrogenase [Lachnospiraceae bacterium]|nr:nucleotide sugar dehydrogenase [Lachnospiraceae bacterium]